MTPMTPKAQGAPRKVVVTRALIPATPIIATTIAHPDVRVNVRPVRKSEFFMKVFCLGLGLVLVTAAASAQQLVETDPVLQKADNLYTDGQGMAARAIYSAYLEDHPSSWKSRLMLARIAYRNYHFDEARLHLETALSDHPEQAVIAAELGHLFHRWSTSPFNPQPHYAARAREHLTQALAMEPENPTALTHMAEFELAGGDTVSAAHHIKEALTLNPNHIPAYHAQTRLYIKLNDLLRARETLIHALELNPKNSETYFLTARLLDLADHPADAIKYAKKSEQLDFGFRPERIAFIAEQHEKLGELTQAEAYYEQLLSRLPGHAESLYRVAQLKDRQGVPDQSVGYYRQAIQANPDLMAEMRTEARQGLRSATTPSAIEANLSHWRRILAVNPGGVEAIGAIAALHTHHRLISGSTLPILIRDQMLVQRHAPVPMPDRVRLDIAKMEWAVNGNKTPVQALTASTDPFVSGEALFLVGRYAEAYAQLNRVDGLPVDEYLMNADRLLLDRETRFSRVYYQRALDWITASGDTSENRLASIRHAVDRVRGWESRAEQLMVLGDQLFDQEAWTEAAAKYGEAAELNPENVSAWLKLGEAWDELDDHAAALSAYKTAISLNPSLMDSEGFAKQYRRLEKKAARD